MSRQSYTDTYTTHTYIHNLWSTPCSPTQYVKALLPFCTNSMLISTMIYGCFMCFYLYQIVSIVAKFSLLVLAKAIFNNFILDENGPVWASIGVIVITCNNGGDNGCNVMFGPACPPPSINHKGKCLDG